MLCPVLVSAPKEAEMSGAGQLKGLRNGAAAKERPNYQIWAPLSREGVRLRGNVITEQVEGVGEEVRKKKRRTKSKSMQHHKSTNPASLSTREHLRKLLEIRFKPVRVPSPQQALSSLQFLQEKSVQRGATSHWARHANSM